MSLITMEPIPSFTFQKEHPGRRTLFGKVDLVLGLSIISVLLVVLIWIGAMLLSNIFTDSTAATQERTNQKATRWNKELERNILSVPIRVAKVKEYLDNHIYGSLAFDFIRNNTLRTVSIKNVDIKAGKPLSDSANAGQASTGGLTLEGEAADFDSLAHQIVWLRQLDTVSTLSLTSITRQAQGRITFTVALEVSPGFFNSSKK